MKIRIGEEWAYDSKAHEIEIPSSLYVDGEIVLSLNSLIHLCHEFGHAQARFVEIREKYLASYIDECQFCGCQDIYPRNGLISCPECLTDRIL